MITSKRYGLDAATKLESQIKNAYESIVKVKSALDSLQNNESNKRVGMRHSIEVKDLISYPQAEKTTIHVNLEGVPFSNVEKPIDVKNGKSSQKSNENVFQRLLNSGTELRIKQELLRRQASQIKETQDPEITKAAKELKREESIEQLLMKRKEEYRAHIEEMRKRREQEEISLLRSPRICKQSKALHRPVAIHNRLHDMSKNKNKKIENLKKQLEDQEMKEVKGSPQINAVSKKMNRSIESILKWEKEKKEKIKKREEDKKKIEVQECKAPKINIISRKIAEYTRQGPVEVHLLAQHERKKAEWEEKVRMEKEKEMNEASPLISIHSANLHRNINVYDRLYNVAKQSQIQKTRRNFP